MSRTGRTDPGGKLTQRLDIPMSEEAMDAISTMATLAGVPKCEYARGRIERAIFGEVSMARRVLRTTVLKRWDESPEGVGQER